jgi:putative component of membrane protein insertase Oxa1/YidC/SpoIIIJ protein YidD
MYKNNDEPNDGNSSENCVYTAESREECIAKTLELLNNKRARMLIRPNVSLKPGILTFALTSFIMTGLYFAISYLFSTLIAIIALLAILIIALIIFGERVIIYIVHVYQRYAPEKLRLSCCFTPSCSEYMLLAIKKYGAFIGFFKGVNRLFRCHPPNGGVDEP